MHARSYKNLEEAREKASRKTRFDSAKTRSDLRTIFHSRFKHDPYNYDWQLDVSEAILLGLDSVVIAGAGAGKTVPFTMLLLLDKDKKIIIISPLKVLQVDQVRRFMYRGKKLIYRFEQMQILTVAVSNGDTWNSKLHEVRQ